MNSSFVPPSNIPFKEVRVPKIRPVGIVAFPGVEILDLAGPMEVFAFANIGLQRSGICSEPVYPTEVFAEKPGPITSSCGLQIIANKAYSDVHDGIDTLLIAGSPDVDCILCDPALQDWVRAMAPQVRRLASVCTGFSARGKRPSGWPSGDQSLGLLRTVGA